MMSLTFGGMLSCELQAARVSDLRDWRKVVSGHAYYAIWHKLSQKGDLRLHLPAGQALSIRLVETLILDNHPL